MSVNFDIKTKKALFLNGKQITDCVWDNIQRYENNKLIIATNENKNKNISIYGINTGKLLFEWGPYFSYKITSEYIEFSIQDMGMAFYGAISFEGKILVPFAFGSVKPTKYNGVWEVTCSKGTKAYYITKTKQVINADDIASPNDFEWDFLVDNEWKRYSYISGIYGCIN